MAITIDDFSKIWASTSPLTPYEFSEANYKQGWNFIGSTPPARQMWDFLQKNNDEKMQYLANNYLPLSGGTMTGAISLDGNILARSTVDDSFIYIYGGTAYNKGACLRLFGIDSDSPGEFNLTTRKADGDAGAQLYGAPAGTLKWNSKEVERVNASGTNYIRYDSGLQICWGTGSTSSGIHQYTFPVAFSATPSVSLTLTSAENSTGYFCKIADLSETGVKALTMTANSTYTQLRTYYIAVGYWK